MRFRQQCTSHQESQTLKKIKQQSEKQPNQIQNVFNLRISVLIFILAIIFAVAIFRYQEYEEVIYQKQHQPKKQQILQSQASKILQNEQKQKQTIQENKANLLFQFSPYKIQQSEHTIYNFPILPQLRIPIQQKKVTVVVTTCCQRFDLLEKALESFFQFNTFKEGLQKFIVVNDGPQNQQLKNLKERYQNITWLITESKIGQIQAIDKAYQQVQTPFVFHLQDDWIFQRGNFIQISFDYFQRIPNLLQTWLKISNQKVDLKTRIVQSEAFGFSFNPGLKKMEHYQSLQKGYTWISKDISSGKGAGKAESLISKYYKKKKFVVAQTQLNYVKHIGEGRSLPKANF